MTCPGLVRCISLFGGAHLSVTTLDLLNKVGNGAIKAPSVDNREHAATHARADALPVKHEADLGLVGASWGELVVVVDGDPEKRSRPLPVRSSVELLHPEGGPNAALQHNCAGRVGSQRTRWLEVDSPDMPGPTGPLLDLFEMPPRSL